jgi:predicted RNase H-like HicB family nuclease
VTADTSQWPVRRTARRAFYVFVPGLPGCFTRGDTLEVCRENAAEANALHFAGLEADREEVPEEHGPSQLLSVTVTA